MNKGEMGHIKDVTEIIKISDSHDTPNNLACKYIIRNVDSLIRTRATNQYRDATFQIPAMIVSNPHYNRKRVTSKVAAHYEHINFTCTVDMEEYSIIVSWGRPTKGDNETSSEESESEEDEEESSSDDEMPKPIRKITISNPSAMSLKDRVESMK